MRDLFSLDGRIAVVAGGAGLIGRALVEGLASFGAHVYIADYNLESAEQFASELRGRKLATTVVMLDIYNTDSISECVDKVLTQAGKIDVWVNSAYPKIADWGLPFEKVPSESWRMSVDGQLNGYCFCSRQAAEAMRSFRKGSIINLGSTYGMVGPDFSIYEGTTLTMPAAYAAIKGGIINFTRYLASYYAKEGIRVNCLSPGGIENNQPEVLAKNYGRRTLLGRMATADEMVGATVFLASDASSYVTGHNLVVDGGWTAI